MGLLFWFVFFWFLVSLAREAFPLDARVGQALHAIVLLLAALKALGVW